jgi:hypothetical protein
METTRVIIDTDSLMDLLRNITKVVDSISEMDKLNLDDIEKVVGEAYHKDDPGRPPRNPMGIFKALIKRLKV